MCSSSMPRASSLSFRTFFSVILQRHGRTNPHLLGVMCRERMAFDEMFALKHYAFDPAHPAQCPLFTLIKHTAMSKHRVEVMKKKEAETQAEQEKVEEVDVSDQTTLFTARYVHKWRKGVDMSLLEKACIFVCICVDEMKKVPEGLEVQRHVNEEGMKELAVPFPLPAFSIDQWMTSYTWGTIYVRQRPLYISPAAVRLVTVMS
mmetsp:Transcript_37971/g.98018  ORF Transcript_37971/g.98018 Transcript_37971/m.98018 type:complete len:204 (+) Transcript_37971:1512-2123(+)